MSIYQNSVFIPEEFVAHLSTKASDSLSGLLTYTLQNLADEELNALSIILLANPSALSADYLLPIARQARNKELFIYAVKQASLPDTNVRPAYLNRLNSIWADNELEDILDEMLTHKVYPDLAISQIAELSQLSDKHKDFLVSKLSDKRLGGSAASTLAKHMNAIVLEDLRQLLASDDRIAKRRVMLALKLSANPDAIALLEDYFRDEPNTELRQEVMP